MIVINTIKQTPPNFEKKVMVIINYYYYYYYDFYYSRALLKLNSTEFTIIKF